MEAIAIFTANILFLALVGVLVFVERRLARLEITSLERAADCDERLFCFSAELDALKKMMREESADVNDEEQRKLQQAEKRFSEGVANILGYEYRAPFFAEADSDILSGNKVRND